MQQLLNERMLQNGHQDDHPRIGLEAYIYRSSLPAGSWRAYVTVTTASFDGFRLLCFQCNFGLKQAKSNSWCQKHRKMPMKE